MCRITEAMSLTDLGCKTAKGSSWYRFPKSLEAGWTSSNSKWPSRGSAFNEEMLLEKQQANLKAMQLSSSKAFDSDETQKDWSLRKKNGISLN